MHHEHLVKQSIDSGHFILFTSGDEDAVLCKIVKCTHHYLGVPVTF